MEFLRDLLGVPISVGCVHEDLSGIRVGLHDEIFHGGAPVLAGVDAQPTYCYLPAAEQRRDADT